MTSKCDSGKITYPYNSKRANIAGKLAAETYAFWLKARNIMMQQNAGIR